MTATIVEMHHEQRRFVFRCPLTGSPLAGNIDETDQAFASPYFLFCVTEEGRIFSRRDDLPSDFKYALDDAIEELMTQTTSQDYLLYGCQLHKFMHGVVAHWLPDTTLIFDLMGRQIRFPQAGRAWVAMDFTLPAKPAAECRVEYIGTLFPPV